MLVYNHSFNKDPSSAILTLFCPLQIFKVGPKFVDFSLILPLLHCFISFSDEDYAYSQHRVLGYIFGSIQ